MMCTTKTQRPTSLRPAPSFDLPGRRQSPVALPATRENSRTRINEPARPSLFSLPGTRGLFAGDQPTRKPPLVFAPLFDDVPENLQYEYQKRKVRGLIYTEDFIARERARSEVTPTAVIDLDKTLAIENRASHEAHYDLHADFDADTQPWCVRPGLDGELNDLKRDGVRLVLWSGGDHVRTWSFFLARPDLLPLFDLIITQENYFAFYLEQLISRQLFDTEPLRILNQDAAQLAKSMQAYHPSFSPKWIALLGYHVLADDHDGLDLIRDQCPFGFYETVIAPPFTHAKPVPHRGALAEKFYGESAAIANSIRAALKRKGFALP